ncbi:MAG: bifunctional diaminohydroxyphosphoribosylaminopyrimidine deaminase/5-amino-6-(5-phosphoribosylamino)uracil reductase RibD, partial [Candidatus Hydrogenedentota bacterium]
MKEELMQKALELSRSAIGFNSPNPLVGAVIEKNGEIIGNGYHKIAGTPHAEINAIEDALKKNKRLEGSTMYVTLEPCAHFGKTPPCLPEIVKHKISKLIISAIDPDTRNRGKGVELLKNNNIDVELGICNRDSVILNSYFFMAKTKNRPLVTGKYAMTMDGKIATEAKESKWISCEKSRKIVQKLRRESDAVIVGVGTIIVDNPRLTYRPEETEEQITQDDLVFLQPYKIVIDPVLQIPEDSYIINKTPELTILFCMKNKRKDKAQRLKDKGIEIIGVDDYPIKGDVILNELYKRDIYSVLIEGGGKTLGRFFYDNLIDRVFAFVCPMVFGGSSAPTPACSEGILDIKDARKFRLESSQR